MEKYIGNIKLNFDFYKGNDLYSDGVVEDELLDIVKNYSEYEDIIKERKEWPIIYHLSKIRENIIEWIPINKTDNVLEVGSGCGAITGILSKKAKQVDCIELSQKKKLYQCI